MRALLDWVDLRLGYRKMLHVALDEPVRGGARWAYVFGSALVILFAVQAVTGMALAAYYSPSTMSAWGSINYLQTQVYLGWLLRGVHHFGAGAMVVVLGAHLLQTVWHGAFKSPRELNWLAGFLMLQLVLAFALTGYLLPWDQKGYWATQVATSIMGTVPLVGEQLQRVVQGGTSYGNLTLTRFYALHILALPALLTLLIAIHIYLFRRRGVTVHPSIPEDQADRQTEPFFPGQLLRDAAFAVLVLGVVLYFAIRDHGAPLEAPADPSSQFLARPEWYFLPLFELLKYFEGRLEVVGTVVIPTVAMAFLAALPFLHSGLAKRTRAAHGMLATAIIVGVAAAVGLGVLAAYQDHQNPVFTQMAAQEKHEAATASALAHKGIPVGGPLLLYMNDPVARGEKAFIQSCQPCHHVCSNQPYKGDPCLEGYASRAWIAKLLKNPQSPYFFGNSHIDEMDAYSGSEQNLNALVEFLYSQSGRTDVNASLAQSGQKLFESEGCTSCHSLDAKGTGDAPDLKGYASAEWLSGFIRHPDVDRYYAGRNKMKVFKPEQLSDEDLSAIVAYLHSQASQPVKFP